MLTIAEQDETGADRHGVAHVARAAAQLVEQWHHGARRRADAARGASAAATRSPRRSRPRRRRKHQPSPTAAMMHAADRRSDQAAAVDHRRVERDRVGQIVGESSTISTTNACRAGVSKALITPWSSCSTMICAHGDQAATASATASSDRLHAATRLRQDQHAVAVPAIDDDAGERREQQRRNLPGEADDAEEQLRTGEPIDQPARPPRG